MGVSPSLATTETQGRKVFAKDLSDSFAS